jgi:mannose-6-phosphate isomerase
MPPNIIDHFYAGGARLARLRNVDLPSPRRPEEWLAASMHRAGEPTVGPSRLGDGTRFADLVAADPQSWLGESASPDTGVTGDTGILVKLLDADQRLPVHVHPTRPYAHAHLHSCYGKTEAWYVIAAEGDDPAVWIGWREPVEPGELARRVDAQDSDWMLDRLNKITVRPGDGILVPAGTAHAIGAGVFVVEVQEPSDFSILLEWSVTTAGRDDSHLDLGMDVALTAVDHGELDPATLRSLVRHTEPTRAAPEPIRLLTPTADEFFRLDVLTGSDDDTTKVPAGFAVVIVLDGTGELTGADGAVSTHSGQVWAVPASFGSWAATGDLHLVLARPAAGWPADVVTA